VNKLFIQNPELRGLINLTSPNNSEDIENNINWNHFYDFAKFHGLTSLVNLALKGSSKIKVPKVIADKLSDDSKHTYLFNSLLVDQLIKIVAKLNENNITVVPFKGPLFAINEYKDISSRMFSDLDLFINMNDFKKIKELLYSMDYEQLFKLKSSVEQRYLSNLYYSNFKNSNNGIDIDLHWATAPKNLTHSLNLDFLSDEIIKTKLNDKDMLSFNSEAYMLLLCQHGCKHSWSRLIWVYDIVKILENSERLDWDKIISLSHQKNSTKMLLTGLNIANMLYCVELPNEINKKIVSDSAIEKISINLIKNIEDLDPASSKMHNDLIYIQTIEKISDKINLLLNHLRPTPNEFVYNLPDNLFFGYYILRPARLTLKQFKRMLH